MKNKQVLLAARPQGAVEESHFRIVESDIPSAGDGEFVVRAHYLSLDPYMRGRMDDAKSYAAKAEIGSVMVGMAVGEVIESRHEKFKAGDFVETRSGWQQYGVSNGGGARETGGTGLGLAIVKHILNRHQATLEISSEPGKGSRFAARFPARRVVPATAALERVERDVQN